MIVFILLGVISIMALILAWQDYSTRMVSTGLIAAVWVSSCSLVIYSSSIKYALIEGGKSWLFIALVLGVLRVYSGIRFKGSRSFLNEVFALGDILFLLAVGPLFTVFGISVFIGFSSALAITVTLALRGFQKAQVEKIPFVSHMSIVLIVFISLFVFKLGNIGYFPFKLFNLI